MEVSDLWQVRIVNDLIVEPRPRWSLLLGTVYQELDNGASAGNRIRWISMGARPGYHVSRYFSVKAEAGWDHTDQRDGPAGSLWKLTIAPQITPQLRALSRPALRAYATWARWSDDFVARGPARVRQPTRRLRGGRAARDVVVNATVVDSNNSRGRMSMRARRTLARYTVAVTTGALALMLGALAAGCSSAPRQRPVKVGSVDTGTGSLEAIRRQLQGTWDLVALEAVDAGRLTPVNAAGRLLYDEFGNMSIKGTIDDPRLKDALRLDYSGRVVIDTARQELVPAEVSAGEASPDPAQLGRIATTQRRRYAFEGDLLKITYLDAAGNPTGVATWRRAP